MSSDTDLRQRVLDRLGAVVDPCMEAAGLGLSLVDLGVVRRVDVDEREISVELGLTEPGCAFTHALVTKVEDALAELDHGRELSVSFNWSTPWTEAMMTDAGRAVFGAARKRNVASLRGIDGASEPREAE